MGQQLAMTDLLDDTEEEYWKARAVKPCWLVPCEAPGCEHVAAVGDDSERPYLCVPCELERGA